MIKHTMTLSRYVAIMAVLGVAWPVLFGDGSAAARLLIRNYEVKAVGDAEFEAAMADQLYGDSLPGTSVQVVSEPPIVNAYVTHLHQLDLGVSVICLLVTMVLAFTHNNWPRLCLLYLLPGVWLLANAYAITLNGGKAFAELAIPAHATASAHDACATSARCGLRLDVARWLGLAACSNVQHSIHTQHSMRSMHPVPGMGDVERAVRLLAQDGQECGAVSRYKCLSRATAWYARIIVSPSPPPATNLHAASAVSAADRMRANSKAQSSADDCRQ